MFGRVYDREGGEVVGGNVVEGGFGIMVEGRGLVVIAGGLFIEFFQWVEDYY